MIKTSMTEIRNKMDRQLFWSFEIGASKLFGIWDLDIGI
jgi:hypothetical protein